LGIEAPPNVAVMRSELRDRQPKGGHSSRNRAVGRSAIGRTLLDEALAKAPRVP
jgi:hypothetical protein